MESPLLSKKKSILLCRNPVNNNKKMAENPAADTPDALEAMCTTEMSTNLIPVIGPRHNLSTIHSTDTASNEEDEVCPREEMRRERKRMTFPSLPVKPFGRNELTVTPTSVPTAKEDDSSEASPLDELKRERQTRSQPLFVQPLGTCHKVSVLPSPQKEERAEIHTGTSLPVKAFGRRESIVPPNKAPVNNHTGASLPVKAFGCHESTVPGSSVATSGERRLPDRQSIIPPSTRKEEEIESRTDSSLPVKVFGRHESTVPGCFVATSGERRLSDRQSIIPPSTRKEEEIESRTGFSLHLSMARCSV